MSCCYGWQTFWDLYNNCSCKYTKSDTSIVIQLPPVSLVQVCRLLNVFTHICVLTWKYLKMPSGTRSAKKPLLHPGEEAESVWVAALFLRLMPALFMHSFSNRLLCKPYAMLPWLLPDLSWTEGGTGSVQDNWDGGGGQRGTLTWPGMHKAS